VEIEKMGCDWEIDLTCQEVSGKSENSRRIDFGSALRVTQGDVGSQGKLRLVVAGRQFLVGRIEAR
jgi:hypothetical protein